ncbi:hypothetical protein EUGRSUZ_C03166 [Eucalyptus grandis]|uniref:Uncharacterized protein n=2 Tax=Eucalyptus grandis TaxID=71139 RepID=A0ACC3LHV4_EUCGR|nr:hypothetical protein EUGRSUZ_C03166 [Eucalyptus grandis]
MIFASELEAYHKYVVYTIDKGFGVKKSKIRKNNKGEITQRTFVCNCEGYSINSSDQKRKYERLEVRCGCPAFIRFKVENDAYEIIDYVYKHNHEFISEHQRHLIKCGRMISDTCNGILVDMMKAGIGGTMTYKFLANKAGGSQNLGFILHDLQNQDGRLTNLFLRDSLFKFDYDCFGDVMVFDTTNCASRYNLICAPFVGVNYHWKNTLFGCAFLLDEIANSFIWLFEVFLKSMENKDPTTIFID